MQRKKLYGVFGWSAQGQILGYIEKSFDMSWATNAVRVWSFKDAQAILKGLQKERRCKASLFLIRVSRANKHFRMQWHKWGPVWARTSGKSIGKWHYRNVFFDPVEKEKENESGTECQESNGS